MDGYLVLVAKDWAGLHSLVRVASRRHGTGIDASHQVGWTGTVANVMQLFGHQKAADLANTLRFVHSENLETISR